MLDNRTMRGAGSREQEAREGERWKQEGTEQGTERKGVRYGG